MMLDPPTHLHINYQSQHQHHAGLLFRRKKYHHQVNHPSHLALIPRFSYNIIAASPIAPPITPPTTSILPAPFLLPDVAEVVAPVAVPVLAGVEEGAADEVLAGMAWTSVALRVPQVLQA